ncbi:hypothetical protein NXC14_CH03387 [Rhizobium sp. NXC14]|uniref:hypothetical protein n=1 Tax=Rhizobium sp. NXC14 TaxID=1981173 RepID=UPI000A201738|nr:hypothetical protein [Rhizobium sp. NXC14]ARO31291.1 hypothetical protein NXC14_CH03387 [Rhizobium sp. NXC14]
MEQNTKEGRQRLRDGYIEMAEQMQPNAFVTLATNGSGDLHEMTRLIGKFCGMMDRELLGHKWHTLPAEERTDGIFFIEHTKTNIHAHGLLKFPDCPDADLSVLTAFKWSRLTRAGETNFQPIYDAGGVAGYCTKEMQSFSFDGDQVVLVRQFMKH